MANHATYRQELGLRSRGTDAITARAITVTIGLIRSHLSW